MNLKKISLKKKPKKPQYRHSHIFSFMFVHKKFTEKQTDHSKECVFTQNIKILIKERNTLIIKIRACTKYQLERVH
jgi:hypothetical protein